MDDKLIEIRSLTTHPHFRMIAFFLSRLELEIVRRNELLRWRRLPSSELLDWTETSENLRFSQGDELIPAMWIYLRQLAGRGLTIDQFFSHLAQTAPPMLYPPVRNVRTLMDVIRHDLVSGSWQSGLGTPMTANRC